MDVVSDKKEPSPVAATAPKTRAVAAETVKPDPVKTQVIFYYYSKITN
jgi:hypothetical protein